MVERRTDFDGTVCVCLNMEQHKNGKRFLLQLQFSPFQSFKNVVAPEDEIFTRNTSLLITSFSQLTEHSL